VALEKLLGRLQELLDKAPHSELRELNNMGADVGGCLNRVAVAVGNTRAVVDIIRAEAQGHTIMVAVNLSITRVSTRDVVVHAPEEVECHSHTMAGIGEVVLDEVFLKGHPEQFPSCTKPLMSSIKPRWFHHLHRDLAHPHSLRLR
jgi:hypothetical protein